MPIHPFFLAIPVSNCILWYLCIFVCLWYLFMCVYLLRILSTCVYLPTYDICNTAPTSILGWLKGLQTSLISIDKSHLQGPDDFNVIASDSIKGLQLSFSRGLHPNKHFKPISCKILSVKVMEIVCGCLDLNKGSSLPWPLGIIITEGFSHQGSCDWVVDKCHKGGRSKDEGRFCTSCSFNKTYYWHVWERVLWG